MSSRTRPTSRDQRLNAAVFLATALIGGGNPVGVAIAVDELDPIWAAAARFLAAGAIFAAPVQPFPQRIRSGPPLDENVDLVASRS